jgi:O-antigen/teichoic acid export membrane protein
VPTIVVNIVANLVLIPRYGADGAAVAALSSSALLAVLSVGYAQRRLGRVRAARAFGGPVLAAVALAAVGTTIPASVLVRAPLALAAYAATLALFELALFNDDVTAVLRASPVRLRSRASPPGQSENANPVR